MSTLQEAILQEADGITTETRVCGITQERVGGLFTKIGTELGILDAAKETPEGAQAKATKAQRDAEVSAIKFADYAREDAKRYTDDVAATKAEALIEATKPVGDRNATWFYSPNGYNAGRNVYFGTAENGLRLTSHETSETLSYIKTRNGVAGDRHTVWTDDNFNPSEYVKSAELSGYMQVYAAGKISGDGNTSTLYTGVAVTPNKTTANRYRVSHNLGNTNYMVNITPVFGVNRSFSVTIKSTTYFEVQFDLTTDFEFQILKY